MMDMAHYYSIHPEKIYYLNVRRLSVMYSAMLSNKAAERIARIEEISVPYMKDKVKDKFIQDIFKQIDDKYAKPHMISESELKRTLGNVGHTANY
jgi:hypothetical protein